MELSSKDVPTALIHLYRGELGRMTAYRARLDTSTNWAVGTTAAVVSFALGDARAPHYVLFLALLFVLVFLWIEVRRFRFYELIRRRVRWLETGFYARVLGEAPEEGWEARLCESLKRPEAPITRLQALSLRLRRNYIWLILVVYAGWILKLAIHRAGRTFEDAARIGPLPGTAVLVLAFLLLLALFIVSRLYRPQETE